MLHRPARFRAVCPLLKSTPKGWLCSVDTPLVRPFWGRAAGILCALTLTAWLGGAVAVDVAAHALGYSRVRLLDVAWPGRWGNLRLAQADRFHTQALAALGRTDYRTAVLALSSAYTLDPSRLDAGLLLAAIHEHSGNHAASDTIYGELLRRRPTDHARIVVAWHDSLLFSGRLEALAALALREMERDLGRDSTAWGTLVFALEHLKNPEAFYNQTQAPLATLPANLRVFTDAIRLHLSKQTEPALAALREFVPENSAQARALVDCLIAWQQPLAALNALGTHRAKLDPFRAVLFDYTLARMAGNTPPASAAFAKLLSPPITADRLDAICARLILTPDLPAANALFNAFPTPPSRPEMLTALWLASSRQDAPAATALFAGELARVIGHPVPPLPPKWTLASIQQLRLVLPLTREVAYALVALTTTGTPAKETTDSRP